MRTIKIIFNVIIKLFSILLFSSKRIVIVGGWYGERLADNSKGVYLYLNQNKQRLGIKKAFWYTNDKKIYERLRASECDVLYGININSIFWHLRAGVHLVDQGSHDLLGWLSAGAIKINMWHGIPLKSIGRDPASGITGLKRWLINWSSGGVWRECFGVAPSKKAAELLSPGLGIDVDRFLILSYPRTLPLYDLQDSPERENFNVFYLPTFRDHEKCPLLDLDLGMLNRKLSVAGIFLRIKPHYASRADWEVASNYSNIVILEAEKDVYEDLVDTDLLVTDYSSVYFDYMLTGKPILFFCYDLDYYMHEDRGFLLDYEEYTPGEKVYDAEKMIDKVIWISKHQAEYQLQYREQYQRINQEMNLYYSAPNMKALDRIFPGIE